MTQKTKTEILLELADRCEQATGPDRELDVDIVFGVYPDIGPYQPLCKGDDPIFWNDPYRKKPCPAFTASLDAVLTLAPDGMEWLLSRVHDTNDGGKAYFYASISESQVHYGALPALAFCAATLRAKAAMEK